MLRTRIARSVPPVQSCGLIGNDRLVMDAVVAYAGHFRVG